MNAGTDGRRLVALATLLPVVLGCPRAPESGGAGETAARPPVGSTIDAEVPGPPPVVDLGEAASPVVDGLQAEIRVYREEGRDGPRLLLGGRIWNRSAGPVRLYRMPLAFPMLCFEVRDAAGERIPPGPPPVPPEDGPEWRIDLEPDMDYLWDASFSDVVAIDLDPGPYRIRLVYENPAGAGGEWTGRLETEDVAFDWPLAAE